MSQFDGSELKAAVSHALDLKLCETLERHLQIALSAESISSCFTMLAGLTGVKVDCQAGVGVIGSSQGGGGAVALKYHTALEDSIRDNFPGNHCINCMCHSTENLYRYMYSLVTREQDGCI